MVECYFEQNFRLKPERLYQLAKGFHALSHWWCPYAWIIQKKKVLQFSKNFNYYKRLEYLNLEKRFLLFSFEIIPIVSLSSTHYLSFLDFILCKFVTQLWSFLSSFSRGFAHETILVYTNVIGTMFFKDFLKPYLKIVLNHCYEYKNSITLPPVLPWIFCYVICYKHDNFGWERVPLR